MKSEQDRRPVRSQVSFRTATEVEAKRIGRALDALIERLARAELDPHPCQGSEQLHEEEKHNVQVK